MIHNIKKNQLYLRIWFKDLQITNEKHFRQVPFQKGKDT